MTEGQSNFSSCPAETTDIYNSAGVRDVQNPADSALPGSKAFGVHPGANLDAHSEKKKTRWIAYGGLVLLGIIFGTTMTTKSSSGATSNPTVTELRTELDSAKRNLNTAKQETQEAQNEKSRLETRVKELEESEGRVSELSTQVSTLTGERDSCKSELQSAKQASRAKPLPAAALPQTGGSVSSSLPDAGTSTGAGDSSSGLSGGSAYYKNCAAARAAGAAPIYRGQPGYRPGLDRDNDGVACERR